jgi:hypothetical protein
MKFHKNKLRNFLLVTRDGQTDKWKLTYTRLQTSVVNAPETNNTFSIFSDTFFHIYH